MQTVNYKNLHYEPVMFIPWTSCTLYTGSTTHCNVQKTEINVTFAMNGDVYNEQFALWFRYTNSLLT